VVVNRVATAVAVERLVRATGHDVILVTGRIRPIDRDMIVRRLEARAGAGRVRSDEDHPVVVVATQAIEAGADLDLDVLVTECASLDALQQRFGRVDRAGVISALGRPATSVVLGASSAMEAGSEDPVYGTALSGTWAWLGSVATDGMLDFGSGRLPVPEGEGRRHLLPPQVWCPQLFPSQLDRWAQTSTEPLADPVVAHWLHGLEERSVDVSVTWRADVTSELLASIVRENLPADEAAAAQAVGLIGDLLEACPPDSREAMGLPVRAVRQWLVDRRAEEAAGVSADVFDVAGQPEPGSEDRLAEWMAPVVLLAPDGGPGETEVTNRPSKIRPGATIVVPLGYGGIRSGSWDPKETAPVVDRATAARALADRRAVLRLFSGGVNAVNTDDDDEPARLTYPERPEPAADADPRVAAADDDEAVESWLRAFIATADARVEIDRDTSDTPAEIEIAVARHLLRWPRTVRPFPHIGTGGYASTRFVVTTRRLLTRAQVNPFDQPGAAIDSEPETSSFVGCEVPLSVHLADVRQWGELLARNLGLPREVTADIALAGWFHDLGKADPRFQLMLRQGTVGATAGLLAKSALAPGDRIARRDARRASGYPRGARHELLSVAMVQDHAGLMAQAHDRDLVLHLVASHHGHCRPFAPVVLDDRPVEAVVEHDGVRLAARSDHTLARLDSGIPERFWRLVERYGWWELAWLEAVLRLADHRASEFEQLTGDDDERNDR
jgi:CRISPR-associated endonuclease/helicase Cas3